MKAVVRRACTADIDEICRIESASSASPWSRDSISHDVETNADAYVAVLCCGSCCNESSIEVNCPEESCLEEGRNTAWPDIRICGYADMWMIAGEAQLNNIAVDADMRRRGYGRMLLEHMTDSCKRQGCSSMTLEVRRSNDAAISMYRSAGFTEAGIRPRYYLDNNEDAVIMDNKFD
jgi:ribosomal-protein-alanine N-acetyltransferase